MNKNIKNTYAVISETYSKSVSLLRGDMWDVEDHVFGRRREVGCAQQSAWVQIRSPGSGKVIRGQAKVTRIQKSAFPRFYNALFKQSRPVARKAQCSTTSSLGSGSCGLDGKHTDGVDCMGLNMWCDTWATPLLAPLWRSHFRVWLR